MFEVAILSLSILIICFIKLLLNYISYDDIVIFGPLDFYYI